MKTIKKVLVGASLMFSAVNVYAQNSGVSVRQSDVRKEIEQSPFSGSFVIGVGNDSNAMASKNNLSGSFYQVSPTLNYDDGFFTSTLTASLMDFSDQNLSNNARETAAGIALGVTTKLFDNTTSKTGIGIRYSDSRWPDLFKTTAQEIYFGTGMPVRYSEASVSQDLGWKIDRMDLNIGGSYAYRDYSSVYSDFAKPIFGPRQFENDQKITKGNVRIAVKLNDAVSVGATPSIAHKKYDDRPARETDGSKAGSVGASTATEFVANDLRADIRINAGPLSLTPYVATGVQMDQTTGGEDYTKTGGGLELAVVVASSINLKFSGGIDFARMSYDNWTYALKGAAQKRQDDETISNVALSMDVSKAIGLSLNYNNINEKSTYVDTDENYVQEIVTTNLTVRF